MGSASSYERIWKVGVWGLVWLGLPAALVFLPLMSCVVVLVLGFAITLTIRTGNRLAEDEPLRKSMRGILRQSFAAMKAASALREALWAMVSDVHLKTPGVDYKAHAKDYLARFEKLMPA